MKSCLVYGVILLALFGNSCSDSSSGPSVLPRTLQVGVLLPETGFSPINGTAQKAAVELAIDDINAYFTSNNLPAHIEAVIRDTQGSIDEESRLLDEMAEQEIPIVICSMTSSSLALIKPQIDAGRIIVLNDVGTSPQLSLDDNLFRLVPDDRYSARVMADFLSESGIEKIIIYYRNDLWGTTLQEEIASAFTAPLNGGIVADSIVYDARLFMLDMDEKVDDLNTSLTQALIGTTADKVAVILISFEEGIEILKRSAAYPALSSVEWYTGDGLGQNMDLLNDAAATAFACDVGLQSPLIAEADSDLYRDLRMRIQAKTGLDHYAFAPVIYDAVWLAALTMAEAGSNAGSALIRTALIQEAEYYDAVTGIIEFNSAGDRSACGYDFWAVDLVNGDYAWVKMAAGYFSATAAPSFLSESAPGVTTGNVFQQIYQEPLPEPTLGEFMETLSDER